MELITSILDWHLELSDVFAIIFSVLVPTICLVFVCALALTLLMRLNPGETRFNSVNSFSHYSRSATITFVVASVFAWIIGSY